MLQDSFPTTQVAACPQAKRPATPPKATTAALSPMEEEARAMSQQIPTSFPDKSIGAPANRRRSQESINIGPTADPCTGLQREKAVPHRSLPRESTEIGATASSRTSLPGKSIAVLLAEASKAVQARPNQSQEVPETPLWVSLLRGLAAVRNRRLQCL